METIRQGEDGKFYLPTKTIDIDADGPVADKTGNYSLVDLASDPAVSERVVTGVTLNVANKLQNISTSNTENVLNFLGFMVDNAEPGRQPRSTRSILKAMKVPHAEAKRMLDKLEEQGFIKTLNYSGNGQSYNYHVLTEEGEMLYHGLHKRAGYDMALVVSPKEKSDVRGYSLIFIDEEEVSKNESGQIDGFKLRTPLTDELLDNLLPAGMPPAEYIKKLYDIPWKSTEADRFKARMIRDIAQRRVEIVGKEKEWIDALENERLRQLAMCEKNGVEPPASILVPVTKDDMVQLMSRTVQEHDKKMQEEDEKPINREKMTPEEMKKVKADDFDVYSHVPGRTLAKDLVVAADPKKHKETAELMAEAEIYGDKDGVYTLRGLAVMELMMRGSSAATISEELGIPVANAYEIMRVIKEQARREMDKFYTDTIPMQVKAHLEYMNRVVQNALKLAEDESLPKKERTRNLEIASETSQRIISLLMEDKSFVDVISRGSNGDDTK